MSPPYVSPRLCLVSNPLPTTNTSFGWLLLFQLIGGHLNSRPHCSLYFNFLIACSTPQMMEKRPTPSLLPSTPFPPPLILRQNQPLVVCCIPPSSGSHLTYRIIQHSRSKKSALLGKCREWSATETKFLAYPFIIFCSACKTT